MTRFACEGYPRWAAARCPIDPESGELCDCEAVRFRLVRDAGSPARLVPVDEEAES